MSVFNIYRLESVSNGSGRLIRGQDSLTWGGELLGCLHKLINVESLTTCSRDICKSYVFLMVERHVLEALLDMVVSSNCASHNWLC